jgi:Cu-Zn family superoxide dismutase
LNIRKCTRTVSVATLLGDVAGPSRRRPGDTNRQDVGTVSLLQTPARDLAQASAQGNASGRACPHHHAVGKCEPSFGSAGPHFNPGNTHHGIRAEPGHAGDMPNLHIPPTGSLEG